MVDNIGSLFDYLDGTPLSVKVSDLHKSYEANKVLRGINLEIVPGETLVILGKSGSGKSVFLKHIIGLEEPDSGSIYINRELVESSEILKKYRVALVFQSSALFNSLTVGENVGLYLTEHRIFNSKEEIKKIVLDALSIVGLEGKEDQYPSELSGGMRRRVATARALVMNPDLLLFDEPTSGLDPIMTKTIGDLILGIKEKVRVTQIVVTHDIELAFYIADRISILSDGNIAEVGTPGEISESTNEVVKNFITPKLKINNGGLKP